MVASEIVADGGHADAAQVDATDPERVTAHFAAVVDRAAGVDISFNMIGIADVRGQKLADMTLSDYMRPIELGAASTTFPSTQTEIETTKELHMTSLDTATTATAHRFEVPGASLHYEVRGQGPLIVLVGAPMDASSFAPLADRLSTDHTVLTTDPRGINRSPLVDPDQDSTPEMRADDLARLVSLEAGPAVVFGSSGGAVSALALVQAHPERVQTVIAHEPPLEELLDDREQRRAASDEIVATYLSRGRAAAWAKFLSDAGFAMPEPVFAEMFAGELDPQANADERFFFVHEMRASSHWRPDLAALRSVSRRIVVGIGEDSAGQTCDHTSTALATALGTEPTKFPGGHTGFVEDPDAFAACLRDVLASTV
jgi:pimeloyl-ACP methyl ester carboxylesterase